MGINTLVAGWRLYLEAGLITFDKLSLRRGNFVLAETSFTVGVGDRLALVGPNGSGKSTIINLILGILAPTSGFVHIDGVPAWQRSNRRIHGMGYVPDDARLVTPELSASEYWELARKLQGLKGRPAEAASEWALELSDLLLFTPPATPLSSYSHGMTKKTQIIAALQHRPEIVLLDEPANGLDEESWSRLSQAISEGLLDASAVVVSIHDAEWSHNVATDIVRLRANEASSAPQISSP